MEYNLPKISSNKSGFDNLASVVAKASSQSDMQVHFSLSWFDANMSAPLGVVIARLTNALKDVAVSCSAQGTQEILQKNTFLCSYGYPPLQDKYHTTLPYQQFNLNEYSLFGNYLTKNLFGKGLPSMTPELALKFQESLFEIFSNAVTHSNSESGVFVCGQFFPKKKRLDISIADAGVGIPRKVNQTYQALFYNAPQFWDSLRNAGHLTEKGNLKAAFALQLALAKGFTTKTDKTPGGAGLKLIKEFIQHNEGSIQIASGGAYWKFSKNEDSFSEFQSPFPGTVINLEINTADTKSYCLAPSIQ